MTFFFLFVVLLALFRAVRAVWWVIAFFGVRMRYNRF